MHLVKRLALSLVLAWGCSAAGEPASRASTPSGPSDSEPTPAEPTPAEPTPAEPTPAEPARQEPTSSGATVSEPTTREKPVTSSHVRTQADVSRLADGPAPVHVHGVYRLLDVRQRQKGAPVHRGHAVIELTDGHRVLLEPIWSDRALRPQAERALDGQEVVVTGQLLSTPPESPQAQAQIILPTLSPVTSVAASE